MPLFSDFTSGRSWDRMRSAKEGHYFEKKNRLLLERIIVELNPVREEQPLPQRESLFERLNGIEEPSY